MSLPNARLEATVRYLPLHIAPPVLNLRMLGREA
jgi:hypothetical protein